MQRGFTMKKQHLVNAIVYLVAMLAASLLNLAISGLVVKFVDILIAPDFFVFAVVRAVVGILTTSVVLGLVIGYEGFKYVEFSFCKIVIPVFFASLAHFLLAWLLRFFPFVAGGTRYLAGILEQGTDFRSFEAVSDVALWAYIAAFWIAKCIEMAVAVVAGKCGKTLRLKNRKTIRGYPQETE